MKLIVSYRSAIEEESVVVAAVELNDDITQEIALNFNSQVEHRFVLELAATRTVGALIVPAGGLR